MRWTNASKTGFSQSQEFSKNQTMRNSRPPQYKETDISNQKNLIYDLRSELSSLKNQFTRLISKPNQADQKLQRPQSDFHTQQFQNTSSAHYQPRLSYNQRQRQMSHLENISNTQNKYSENEMTPAGKTHSRSNSFASSDRMVSQANSQTNPNNVLISQNHIHKIGPSKNHPQTQKNQEKQNIRFSLNEQSFNKQKQRQYFKIKLSQNSFTPHKKASDGLGFGVNQLQADGKFLQLQSKVKEKEKQNQQLKQKIQSLTDKISQISSSKTKQLQSMRQMIMKAKQSMKKEIETEKQKIGQQSHKEKIKNQQIIHQLQQQKQAYQKQLGQVKQKHQQELEEEIKKLKNSQHQLFKQGQREHEKQIQKLQQKLYKKNQFIKDLLTQREAQKQKEEEKQNIKLQISSGIQIGVNTDQTQNCQQTESNSKNNNWEEILLEKQKELKQVHQKNKIYLNNIDKQNTKIKNFKTQIQLSQKFAAQSEFIINEKENAIHNILKQLKNAEKQILDLTRAHKALENLLYDANEQVIQQKLMSINKEYGQQQD